MKLWAIKIGKSEVHTIVAADTYQEAETIAIMKANALETTYTIEDTSVRGEVWHPVTLDF